MILLDEADIPDSIGAGARRRGEYVGVPAMKAMLARATTRFQQPRACLRTGLTHVCRRGAALFDKPAPGSSNLS
jgi:hypothetical protein